MVFLKAMTWIMTIMMIMIHKNLVFNFNYIGFIELLIINNNNYYLLLLEYNREYYTIMFMNRTYIRENITLISIILFVIMFGFIIMMKPAFLYNKDGSIREFGIGYRNKTILPIWLLSLILGIISYLLVMFYIASPKFF